jgi:NAD(P)-dependent dehydrogenase (short-subunit alcohol dehydrogenase family)
LRALVEGYGDRARVFGLDVTDAEAAVAAVEFAVAEFGRIDVVVNNAGYADSAAIEEMDMDAFRAQIEANLFGVVNVTRAALPVLRRQRSGVVVQSAAAWVGPQAWVRIRPRSSPSRVSPKCSRTKCGRSV